MEEEKRRVETTGAPQHRYRQRFFLMKLSKVNKTYMKIPTGKLNV